MSNDQEINDESSLHDYRTEIPNIIYELELDPYERDVYTYFKKVAGDKGRCYQGLDTICEKLRISRSKLKEVKKRLSEKFKLIGCPLIKVIKRKHADKDWDTDVITIVDIWPINFKLIPDIQKQNSRSPENLEVGRQKTDPRSPKNPKEDLFKEDPKEEEKKEKRKEAFAESKDDASNLSFFIFEAIRKNNPTVSLNPEFESFVKELLKTHTDAHLRQIITWVAQHDFWSKTVASAKTLFKSIETIKKQMQLVPKSKERPLEEPEKPLTKQEITYKALDRFLRENWSKFQAEHLSPSWDENKLSFDTYKGVKFGETCFLVNLLDTSFQVKFNNFMAERNIKLKFNS